MMRYILIAGLLIGLLVGCGGGGSSPTRKAGVTITIQWPNSTHKASRELPLNYNLATVDIFDGTSLLAHLVIPKSSSGVTANLPSKTLIFYANVYPATTDPGWPIDTATGQVNVPAGTMDQTKIPLAHAVIIQDVSQNTKVNFTLNNNIVSIIQVPGSKGTPGNPVPLTLGTAAGPNNTTIIQPNTASIELSNLIQALDASGYTVMLPTDAAQYQVFLADQANHLPFTPTIKWTLDTSDPLASSRATVHNIGDSSGPNAWYTDPMLDLNGVGTVRVTFTDSEANVSSSPYQGAITFTIAPALPINIAANVTQVPCYAQSVTLTLSQDPFAAGDVVPPDLKSSVSFTACQNATATSPTVSENPVIQNFNWTGRTLKLTANAWSNPDGTGTLLATYALDAQPLNKGAYVSSTNTVTYNMPLTFTGSNQTITIK